MLVKHKAKKVYYGGYHYRGYLIDRIDNEAGTTDHWNISEIGDELFPFDGANTLGDAKILIDNLRTSTL